MEIVVIDGQGGGIGKNIIQVLKEKHPEYTIIGVGTNSMATTQLKKRSLPESAGAQRKHYRSQQDCCIKRTRWSYD